MKVSIIIVNYNTPDLIKNCLKSLEKQAPFSYEVIIVDNNSSRRVGENITKEHKGTSVYYLDDNRGFGAGNNFGAKKATGEILWFLNPDTLVPDRSISSAVELLEKNQDLGIISPLLYNDEECRELQKDMAAKFQTLRGLVARGQKQSIDLSKDFFETDVVVGASMLIRKEVFDKIGGFDERIKMFFEDDDLCYRLRRTGYQVGVCTKAKIIHLQGKSIAKNKERKLLYYASQDYFWQKHYGFWPTLLMKIFRWPLKIKNTL